MSSNTSLQVLGAMLSVVKQKCESIDVVLQLSADGSGAVSENHPPLDVGPIDVTETILFEWEGEGEIGVSFAYWLLDGKFPHFPDSAIAGGASAVYGEDVLIVHQEFTMAYIEWVMGVHERRKELN